MRRPVMIFFSLLCLCLASPAMESQISTKCQCMPQPLEKRWLDAEAVFTGTVTGIDTVEEQMQRGNADLPVKVTIHVDEGFKGLEKDSTFLIYSNLRHDTCMGGDFVKGKSYLFYAYMRKPEVYELWSMYDFPSGTYDVGGLCGGMRQMDDPDTAAELEILRAKPKTDNVMLIPGIGGFLGNPPEKPMTGD